MAARRWLLAGLATLVVAIGALGGTAAATRIVTIPSGIKLSVYGYRGRITSPNQGCLSERKVVLKQKGHGVLGRTKSKLSGSWEISPEKLKFKGQPPYELYAEVKPSSEGAAGTIYRCKGATSKTVEIAGG
jgi:hypothetical protein